MFSPPGTFFARMGHGLGHLGVQEMGTSPKVAKGQRKTPLSGWKAVILWLRGLDLNQRPPGYEGLFSKIGSQIRLYCVDLRTYYCVF